MFSLHGGGGGNHRQNNHTRRNNHSHSHGNDGAFSSSTVNARDRGGRIDLTNAREALFIPARDLGRWWLLLLMMLMMMMIFILLA